MSKAGVELLTFEQMPRPSRKDAFPLWLVPARNNIQREMLRLRTVLAAQPFAGTPPWIFQVRHLMIGSCFSLWRAVFQAKDDPGSQYLSRDGAKFLDQLIYNNAATYQTELNGWSLQYYIENAVYRIREARNLAIAAGVDSTSLPEARMIFDIEKMKQDLLIVDATPYGDWEECFHATRALISAMIEALAKARHDGDQR